MKVRQVLFAPEDDPVGEYVKIRGIFFKVAGVFDTRSTGDDTDPIIALRDE